MEPQACYRPCPRSSDIWAFRGYEDKLHYLKKAWGLRDEKRKVLALCIQSAESCFPIADVDIRTPGGRFFSFQLATNPRKP